MQVQVWFEDGQLGATVFKNLQAALAETRKRFGADCELGPLEGTIINGHGEQVAEYGELPAQPHAQEA